jgi:hypothetical protein
MKIDHKCAIVQTVGRLSIPQLLAADKFHDADFVHRIMLLISTSVHTVVPLMGGVHKTLLSAATARVVMLQMLMTVLSASANLASLQRRLLNL